MMDIELTASAVARVKQILDSEHKSSLRLAVKEAGCSGLEYVMEAVEERSDSDLVKSFDGFDLLVDPGSYEKALKGLQLDFQKDVMSSAFVYNNPNQKGECGCGISFSV